MVVDFESLAEQEDQGAALQALVAPQLQKSPSSLFFISNIEYLDSSGSSVLLALIGMPPFFHFAVVLLCALYEQIAALSGILHRSIR